MIKLKPKLPETPKKTPLAFHNSSGMYDVATASKNMQEGCRNLWNNLSSLQSYIAPPKGLPITCLCGRAPPQTKNIYI